MSERIDIVVNRLARRLASGPVLEAIRSASNGSTVHETRSVRELDEVVRAIAARGTTRVVLAGGDGSYMAGLNALARAFGEDALPEIALAPGGTVSTVARNLAWSGGGSLAARAHRVVRAAIEGRGRAHRVPTLRVNGMLGFIFGAGLVATFFDEYYASPQQGYAGAARIVARVFAGSFTGGALARKMLAPQPSVLTVDGHEMAPRAWSLVAASVVRDLGLKMRLTYRASEAHDRVHVIASPLGARALGPQMPLVLLGKRLRGKHHVDVLARDLTLRLPSEGSYVLDGELLRAREVRVGAGCGFTLRVA